MTPAQIRHGVLPAASPTSSSWMIRSNVPLDREPYLRLAYWGETLDLMPAELGADLLECLQDWRPFRLEDDQ